MKILLSYSLITFIYLCCLSANSSTVLNDEFYLQKLSDMQRQLVERQKPLGEWAGLNEGDPRWDVMFLVYTHELNEWGFDFASDEVLKEVKDQTINRLKRWQGFQTDGWALVKGYPADKELTGSILLALNHVDTELARHHFKSQQKKWDKQGKITDLSFLDRFFYRILQAPGQIILPPMSPLYFKISRDSMFYNMSSLGYYRLGMIGAIVWRHFNYIWKFDRPLRPLTEDFLSRKGFYVSNPHLTKKISTQFWANEGLVWLLQRPNADGNPVVSLIIQQAFFAAHRAGAMDLSHVIEKGWRYLMSLRLKKRDNVVVFQPSVSPIWDTSRVLKAISYIPENQRLNSLSNSSDAIKRAIRFLLSEQDVDGGDYRMANPNFSPGGWGFAYGSKRYPDSDDTAMAIEALLNHADDSNQVHQAVTQGISWILQLQNDNGGWPAWDYDATELIEFLIQKAKIIPNTSLEPQVDVTARVLRTLAKVKQSGFTDIPEEVFQKGCHYLLNTSVQSQWGLELWAGTWAVNYLYATSEVVSTLMEVQCKEDFPYLQYIDWIKKIQNDDFGWGESVDSYQMKDFVKGDSTINQTLGALQVLLKYEELRSRHPHWPSVRETIEKGMMYYLSKVNSEGDISDEGETTACYACPTLYVRYDLIPLYMGIEVLAKFINLTEN